MSGASYQPTPPPRIINGPFESLAWRQPNILERQCQGQHDEAPKSHREPDGRPNCLFINALLLRIQMTNGVTSRIQYSALHSCVRVCVCPTEVCAVCRVCRRVCRQSVPLTLRDLARSRKAKRSTYPLVLCGRGSRATSQSETSLWTDVTGLTSKLGKLPLFCNKK